MSLKAITCASSYSMSAAVWRAMMRQKTQSITEPPKPGGYNTAFIESLRRKGVAGWARVRSANYAFARTATTSSSASRGITSPAPRAPRRRPERAGDASLAAADASGRRLVASPLTRRLRPRAQRQLVVDDERIVHPVRRRGVGTRVDGHEIRAHPHDGHGVAPALIAHDPRVHVLAVLMMEHDWLETDHGPAEEVTADARRQTRDARDDRDAPRCRAAAGEEQHGQEEEGRAHAATSRTGRARVAAAPRCRRTAASR